MNHIDKLDPTREATGIEIVQKTLDAKWDSESGHYTQPFDYKHSNHDDIRQLLLEDQNDTNVGAPVCCYCMRRLYYHDGNNHNVTLEHIIPNKINQNDWNNQQSQYQSYSELKDANVNVCIGGVYPDVNQKIDTLPHPHFLSYHNLVASCNGELMLSGSLKASQCCNNRRQQEYVAPNYFSHNIANEVDYNTDNGEMFFDNQNYDDHWLDENVLNLNSSVLKKMRRFWYLVSTTKYTAKDIEAAVSDQDIRDEIITTIENISNEKWQALNNVTYLEWLSDYCWFYYFHINKQTN